MAAHKGGRGSNKDPLKLKESTASMTGLTFSEETLKAAAKKSGGFKKEKQNWQSTLTGTRQRTRHLTYFPFKLISSYNANFPDSQVHATSPDNEPREQHRQTFPGHTYFLKWPDTSVQHLIQASTHKVIHLLRFFFQAALKFPRAKSIREQLTIYLQLSKSHNTRCQERI